MARVQFESIYTETNRYGDTRRFEKRAIIDGSATEICMIVSSISTIGQLPGTEPVDWMKLLGGTGSKNQKALPSVRRLSDDQ